MTADTHLAPNAALAGGPIARHHRACLLLGALGDALGAPLEYLRIEEIRTAHGPRGLTGPIRFNGRIGTISDDTQMLLFTAEGLLDAIAIRRDDDAPPYEAAVGAAYRRWLASQGCAAIDDGEASRRGLLARAELRVQRAPSLTCLDALEAMQIVGQPATNTRSGNVAAGRAAPVGVLFGADADGLADGGAACYALAGRLAALTHGHPTAIHSAGAFATLIAALLAGHGWRAALALVDERLAQHPDATPVRAAIAQAIAIPRSRPDKPGLPAMLGEGWDAHEALAIAIHLARDNDDAVDALLRAVNHHGDSDGCGLMTGCLLGAALGSDGVPGDWLAQLELADVIADHADRLHAAGRSLRACAMRREATASA